MKTQKKQTKDRREERKIKEEIRWEFDNILSDDMLDEIALAECLEEEDYYG